MLRKKGQTVFEYAVLIIVVLAVLIAGGVYFKRGVQGRWKSAVDDLGEQYDPAYMNTRIMHLVTSSTNTQIRTSRYGPLNRSVWTTREDSSTSSESQYGQMTVGTAAP